MIKQQLTDILKQEKVTEIIPFFRSLTPKERDSLIVTIKELHQEYTILIDGRDIKATMNQLTILSVAIFVCMNYKDFKKYNLTISYLKSGFIRFHEYTQKELMQQMKVEDILEWYVPSWFDEFINDPRQNSDINKRYIYTTYLQAIEWYQNGYIKEPRPELCANTLLRCIYDTYYDEKWKRIFTFRPDHLLKYEITLTDHIWLLFKYNTDLWDLPDKEKLNFAFDYLINNGKLDRIRVLKEALLTVNVSEFNKITLSFFTSLIDFLNPTQHELLLIQSELFGQLTCIHSKQVNTALKYIKIICKSSDFKKDDFLQQISILILSTTKSIIISTLEICSLLMDKDNEHIKNQICVELCQGFINKDESIQKKIVNIILQHGQPEEIKGAISVYESTILNTVKPLLVDFLVPSVPDQSLNESLESRSIFENRPLLSDENRIKPVETFEDYVFFLSEITSKRDMTNYFLLPQYMLDFDSEITQENLIQLEPALNRVLKLLTNWDLNHLEYSAYSLLSEYIKVLAKQFPLMQKIVDKINTLPYKRGDFFVATEDIMTQNILGFYQQTQFVYRCLEEKNKLTLVSTPTHFPLWVDPLIFVERLVVYQQNKTIPDEYDMQMAIHRCAREDVQQALALAKTELTGELKDLVVFMFDSATKAPTDVKYSSWWMTAALIKYPLQMPTHLLEWGYDRIPSEVLEVKYQWDIIVDNLLEKEILHATLPKYVIEKGNIPLMLESFFTTKNRRNYPTSDLEYWLCLVPYARNLIMSYLIEICLYYKEAEGKNFRHLLDGLIKLNLPIQHFDYIVLAICMLDANKAIRTNAMELYIKKYNTIQMDSQVLVGEMGRMLSASMMPIKRLTDSIEDQMIGNSRLHNIMLEQLIESLIPTIEKPIPNLKKLLEIYKELIIKNQSTVSDNVVVKLKDWEGNTTLKKTVKELMKKRL